MGEACRVRGRGTIVCTPGQRGEDPSISRGSALPRARRRPGPHRGAGRPSGGLRSGQVTCRLPPQQGWRRRAPARLRRGGPADRGAGRRRRPAPHPGRRRGPVDQQGHGDHHEVEPRPGRRGEGEQGREDARPRRTRPAPGRTGSTPSRWWRRYTVPSTPTPTQAPTDEAGGRTRSPRDRGTSRAIVATSRDRGGRDPAAAAPARPRATRAFSSMSPTIRPRVPSGDQPGRAGRVGVVGGEQPPDAAIRGRPPAPAASARGRAGTQRSPVTNQPCASAALRARARNGNTTSETVLPTQERRLRQDGRRLVAADRGDGHAVALAQDAEEQDVEGADQPEAGGGRGHRRGGGERPPAGDRAAQPAGRRSRSDPPGRRAAAAPAPISSAHPTPTTPAPSSATTATPTATLTTTSATRAALTAVKRRAPCSPPMRTWPRASSTMVTATSSGEPGPGAGQDRPGRELHAGEPGGEHRPEADVAEQGGAERRGGRPPTRPRRGSSRATRAGQRPREARREDRRGEQQHGQQHADGTELLGGQQPREGQPEAVVQRRGQGDRGHQDRGPRWRRTGVSRRSRIVGGLPRSGGRGPASPRAGVPAGWGRP